MTVTGLSIAEFAKRVGLSVNTLNSYRRKKMLPPPDVRIGDISGWFPATIDEWTANRPGRGVRFYHHD